MSAELAKIIEDMPRSKGGQNTVTFSKEFAELVEVECDGDCVSVSDDVARAISIRLAGESKPKNKPKEPVRRRTSK